MRLLKTADLYFVKFPFMLTLLIAGFIFEFLITFPFALAYYIDCLTGKNGPRGQGKT